MNYKIITKYIKISTFEIPDSKIYFNLANDINNYRINIDIKSEPLKDKLILVNTTLSLIPKVNFEKKIKSEVCFSSLVELDGDLTDKSGLEEIILIKVPENIYPELRKIFIYFFEKSGFTGIKIDESIDFKKLNNLRKN